MSRRDGASRDGVLVDTDTHLHTLSEIDHVKERIKDVWADFTARRRSETSLRTWLADS